MYKLKGKVQHYAWGGLDFIPQLLNVSNNEQQPYAEYWLGAHSNAPSVVQLTDNAFTKLPDMIRSEPKRYLGEKAAKQFGELPYLLKVLDVKEMLSIQVHPTKAEAEKGFAAENEKGIPLDAAHRNYKDANHKPEVMVALGDFWLLHGFLPKQQLTETLERTDGFNALLPLFEGKGYYGLYRYVMELPQDGVDEMLRPLAQKIVPLYEQNKLSKMSPDFWAAKVMLDKKPAYTNFDRGIFSIYFFNLVYLTAGQAIFQGAGIPHAYLEGQNVELMSNSDNVLRGGLTPKHIDVPELLKHTVFEAITPAVIDGVKNGFERTYHCPVPDFIIHAVDVPAGSTYSGKATSAEIVLLMNGEAETSGTVLHLNKGDAAVIFSGEEYQIKALQHTKIFKAAVP
ncbi:MAG: mannose-6-phosphate isomerase, class I [Chitinophagaceae bacterium]|nr:mannose-6-phosphate isomerase, class I [Chitinophagaceae bacterium]